MRKKVKAKQPRKPRNYDVVNMIYHMKGGPMKDQREKRKNNPNRSFEKYDE